MTATATTALVPLQPAFSDSERLALAGFLAGYRGLTREAYALDLRQFTTWCRARSLSLFAVRRPTLSPSPGSWKPGAAPGRPSPGGCAPSPGSTVTRSKRSSWTTHPPRTSAVRGWRATAGWLAEPRTAPGMPGAACQIPSPGWLTHSRLADLVRNYRAAFSHRPCRKPCRISDI